MLCIKLSVDIKVPKIFNTAAFMAAITPNVWRGQ